MSFARRRRWFETTQEFQVAEFLGRARRGATHRTWFEERNQVDVEAHLDEPALVGPAGQLGARGELQLAQDARDMRLDRLRREMQPRRDLLVLVAAGDQLQHLALPRCEVLEL